MQSTGSDDKAIDCIIKIAKDRDNREVALAAHTEAQKQAYLYCIGKDAKPKLGGIPFVVTMGVYEYDEARWDTFMVMQDAGDTFLDCYTRSTLAPKIKLLQGVAGCLLQWQSECDFVHGDMHMKNLTIKDGQLYFIDLANSNFILKHGDDATQRLHKKKFDASFDLMYCILSHGSSSLQILELECMEPLVAEFVGAVARLKDSYRKTLKAKETELQALKQKKGTEHKELSSQDSKKLKFIKDYKGSEFSRTTFFAALIANFNIARVISNQHDQIALSHFAPVKFLRLLSECQGALVDKSYSIIPPSPPKQLQSKFGEFDFCNNAEKSNLHLTTILQDLFEQTRNSDTRKACSSDHKLPNQVLELDERRDQQGWSYFKSKRIEYQYNFDVASKSGSYGDTTLVWQAGYRDPQLRMKRPKFNFQEHKSEFNQVRQKHINKKQAFTEIWDRFSRTFFCEIAIQLYLRCKMPNAADSKDPLTTVCEIVEIVKLVPLHNNYIQGSHGDSYKVPYHLTMIMRNGDADFHSFMLGGANDSNILSVLRSVASFLEVASKKYKFMHKDLKSNNIVLHLSDTHVGHTIEKVVLIDFGMAQINFSSQARSSCSGQPPKVVQFRISAGQQNHKFVDDFNPGRDLMTLILNPVLINKYATTQLKPFYTEFLEEVSNNDQLKEKYEEMIGDAVPTRINDFVTHSRKTKNLHFLMYAPNPPVMWCSTRPKAFLQQLGSS